MSRLGAVIRHEYLTVVKQKGFWAYMISVPVIFAIIFLLIGLANRTDNASLEKAANDLKDIAVIDQSGLVSKEIVEASGQKVFPAEEFAQLKSEVESGERKGLINYPANLVETREFNVYVNGTDFIFSTSVTEVGSALLQSSLYAPVGSEETIALAQLGASGITTTFANGTESVGFTRFIIPGAIAAMFFIILMFSIGYILTSIADEKENRSMEMALTYLSPRTLIIGKLIGVVLITFTQLLFFGLLAVLAVVVALNTEFIRLPANFDLSALPVDPTAVGFGLGFLVVGFILFAAMMAFIAVLLPAKQANNWSALFYILPFVPFWFMMTVLTDPSNPVVQFITYFPLTAPTTNLLRNVVGNISVQEAAISLAIMTAVGLLLLWVVIKIFPKGALEFQNPLSLKTLFSKK